MKIKKHNPNFKLIEKETLLNDGNKFISLVYGISNEGKEEGLEAYYYKKNDRTTHFYRSYRWESNNIPEKYKSRYDALKKYVGQVPNGCMLSI